MRKSRNQLEYELQKAKQEGFSAVREADRYRKLLIERGEQIDEMTNSIRLREASLSYATGAGGPSGAVVTLAKAIEHYLSGKPQPDAPVDGDLTQRQAAQIEELQSAIKHGDQQLEELRGRLAVAETGVELRKSDLYRTGWNNALHRAGAAAVEKYGIPAEDLAALIDPLKK